MFSNTHQLSAFSLNDPSGSGIALLNCTSLCCQQLRRYHLQRCGFPSMKHQLTRISFIQDHVQSVTKCLCPIFTKTLLIKNMSKYVVFLSSSSEMYAFSEAKPLLKIWETVYFYLKLKKRQNEQYGGRAV
jgi:hypothetical protein